MKMSSDLLVAALFAATGLYAMVQQRFNPMGLATANRTATTSTPSGASRTASIKSRLSLTAMAAVKSTSGPQLSVVASTEDEEIVPTRVDAADYADEDVIRLRLVFDGDNISRILMLDQDNNEVEWVPSEAVSEERAS
jgi:hypothetical protein